MLSVTVSVSAAATLIHTATNASNRDPQPIRIYNAGAQSVFLGGATVTAATGVPVTSTGVVDLQFISAESIYGITTVGTAEIRVLKGRQNE
jgi:hypothetical protein